MSRESGKPEDGDELRRRAEARLKAQQTKRDAVQADADTLRLVHELQVHQVELELQNAELRDARDAIESALAKYTDLYDFAPISYLTLNRDGAILEANFAAAGLLGTDRARLLKRSFGSYVAAADRPVFAGFLQNVFAHGARESCEVALVLPGSSPIAVLVDAVPAASGLACRVVVTDITARKRAESDHLILGKLESTGILAGGIAHDFNNLLTVIVLELERAQTLAPSDGDLALRLEETKTLVWSARSLTQQLLTFAEGGPSERKPTNLPGIIRESARPALSGSRVRAEFVLPDDLWPAEVDEGQIGQVIRNLVLNAREAMPEGGVVTLHAENVTVPRPGEPSLPPGDYVRVSVTDHGGGIAKEFLPRIFDPYYSTKQRGVKKGMGLGLTICHSIIQKHGGTIDVKSEVGAGTTIRFHLPASRIPLASVPVRREKHPPSPGRILVMDDEDGIRNLVAEALRPSGHEVELARDGQEAIEIYSEAKGRGKPFDVVILDLTVRAGLGGEETMRTLRELDPAIKAIVMSGYSHDRVMLNAKSHGFAGVLTKPFTSVRLTKMIAQVMER